MTYDEGFAAGMRRASDEIVAWHKAEITALERQIEANTDYMRREGLHDHAANDACRSSIHGHNEAIRAVERIRAAIPASAPAHPGGEPMTPDKLAAAGLRVETLERLAQDIVDDLTDSLSPLLSRDDMRELVKARILAALEEVK